MSLRPFHVCRRFAGRRSYRGPLRFVHFGSRGNIPRISLLGARGTLVVAFVIWLSSRRSFAGRTCRCRWQRARDCAGGTRLNRTGAGSWHRKLRTSNDAFASIQHSCATQLVVELSAGHSRGRAGWSFPQLAWRRDSCRARHSNAPGLTSRAAIACRVGRPDWQIGAQRVGTENSSREHVVSRAGSGVASEIPRRHGSHRAVVRWINSLQPRDLVGAQRAQAIIGLVIA